MENQNAINIINSETKLPIITFKSIFLTQEIKELAKALAEAQGEMSDPAKNSSNPYFNSKYADLSEVLGMIRPSFSRLGLALTQHPSAIYLEKGAIVSVVTIIMHTSGQIMASTLEMWTPNATSQSVGGCITYARRYAAAAVAGITQQDDDGNAATFGNQAPPANNMYQQHQNQAPAKTRSSKTPPPPPTQNMNQQVPPQGQVPPPPANMPPQQQYQQPPVTQQQPPAPQAPPQYNQPSPAELEHNNRIAKFTKLQSFAARNEWFCNQNDQYKNGRFGISEIFKAVSGNPNATKDTVTEEQLDFSISLCEYIMGYFEKGGSPDAGPVNIWVVKMLGFMKENLDPIKATEQSRTKGAGIPF